jgi:hypothetical protein
MWDRGIKTKSSCQEAERGYVWLNLARPADVKRFVSLAFPYRDGYYERCFPNGNRRRDRWQTDIFVNHYAADIEDKLEWTVCLVVKFPRKDYRKVTKRILAGRVMRASSAQPKRLLRRDRTDSRLAEITRRKERVR